MNNEDLAMIAKSGDQAALAELYKNNKGVIPHGNVEKRR